MEPKGVEPEETIKEVELEGVEDDEVINRVEQQASTHKGYKPRRSLRFSSPPIPQPVSLDPYLSTGTNIPDMSDELDTPDREDDIPIGFTPAPTAPTAPTGPGTQEIQDIPGVPSFLALREEATGARE